MYIMLDAFQRRAERSVEEDAERLGEMSIRNISRSSDGLPFRVCVKCPDDGPEDHAHILKIGGMARGRRGSRENEIGAFIVTRNPPRTADDLVPYTAGWHKGLSGLSRDELEMIARWANSRNRFLPVTNWRALQYECDVNNDRR